jgi:hypothetical protein
MNPDPSLPPIQIDVGSLVQRSVATLYSHLVTRPTGRAVRQAIESLLADAGDTAFSLIDLSEVTVLDFSCADRWSPSCWRATSRPTARARRTS